MWLMVLLRWYKRASSMNQETGNVKYVYEIIMNFEFLSRVPDATLPG